MCLDGQVPSIAGSALDVPEAWPRNAGEYPLSHGHKSISLWKTAQGSSGVLPGMGMMVGRSSHWCYPPLMWDVDQAEVWVWQKAEGGVNGANDSTDMSYIITALILQA